MALNIPTRVYTEGATEKMSVYRFINLSAGDTFQMSGDFTNVKACYLYAQGSAFSNQPVISANTLLTPGGALSKDTGLLAVFGESS